MLRGVVSFVAVVGIGAAAYLWGPDLHDTYKASQFQPTERVANVAQEIDLTDRGRVLLYASQPAIESDTKFNQDCQSVERTAAMLGCYYRQQIYLFDVQNPELDGAIEVTAAHEMLHAAYDRLDVFEKHRIDTLVAQAYEEQRENPDIKKLVEYYSQAEPGAELNELHSIIGTTVAVISPELETYYGRYFNNRQSVVDMNAKYTAVFKEVEARSTALSAALNQEGEALKADLAQYDAERARLEVDIKAFNDKAAGSAFGSRGAFEASRQALVARVSSLNARRDAINARVASYNDKIAELQSLSIRVDELNKSINGIASPTAGL